MEYSELYAMRIRQLCKQRGINGRTKNPGVVNLHKIALTFNMTIAEFLDFKELNEFSFEDNESDE